MVITYIYIYIWVNYNKFTNLNLAAMNGNHFPKINPDFQGSGEGREVLMKFTQIIYTNQPKNIRGYPWLSRIGYVDNFSGIFFEILLIYIPRV
jgi:hypothetical protein